MCHRTGNGDKRPDGRQDERTRSWFVQLSLVPEIDGGKNSQSHDYKRYDPPDSLPGNGWQGVLRLGGTRWLDPTTKVVLFKATRQHRGYTICAEVSKL